MNLKAAVLSVDAALILFLASWGWYVVGIVAAFSAGWLMSAIYMSRLERDARELYARFKRADQTARAAVEEALRAGELRLYGRR